MPFERIKKFLGEPVYENKDVLLYQGDSLKILQNFDRDSIPLTVTSPPYNIGKEYEEILDLDEYLDWCEKWVNQIYRLTSKNGGFWLNLGYISIDGKAKAIPIPYLLWDRVPFYLVQEVVWNYGAGVAARKLFSPRNEKFLWYVKNSENYIFNLDDVRDPNVKYPNQKKNGKLKCNPNGKNPTDVWQIAKVTSGKNRSSKERTEHPAQFPLELIERIIKASSNQGDIILDPFMGSGSVAEAAIKSGRKSIGIEINPNYVEIAINRLETYRKNNLEHIENVIQKNLFEQGNQLQAC